MIFEKPGHITDRILLLGRKESCVYLLKGNDGYSLLGGGMIHIIPVILEQLKAYNIDEKRIQRILVFHSHFDHCGTVPFLKKRWPWVTVTASAKAKELLSTQRVIETIDSLNQMVFATYGRAKEAEALNLSFTGITVDAVVKEGDVLVCGDLEMEIIDVPGHSSCSIAVYVPQQKALFASDSGGIPFGSRIFTAANSNFDKYINSLKKMASYEIEVFLAEHFGARTGKDATRYLEKSMASAKQTRQMMEASFAKTRDEKKSTEEITDLLVADAPEGYLPKEVIALVVGQTIHYIAKQM
jgi:glyoxylase-like metal-dependent hydrolase (beta-lactamase superfamily II)